MPRYDPTSDLTDREALEDFIRTVETLGVGAQRSGMPFKPIALGLPSDPLPHASAGADLLEELLVHGGGAVDDGR